MARKEVTLFLKHPGPSHVLERLTHSFLECVVERKSATSAELQLCNPTELRSEYQLKGTATVVDDEIVLQFVPKHAGIHTARIFADTREICRPVAFRVTRNCEVEGLTLDRPVGSSNQPQQPLPQSPPPPPPRDYPEHGAFEYASSLASAPPAVQQHPLSPQPQQTQPHPQPHFAGVPVRGFTSDSSLHVRQPESFQRASYISSGPGSRPVSMAQDAGDLFSTVQDQSSFGQLHAQMKSGERSYGAKKDGLAVDHASTLTPEVFRVLSKDIDVQIAQQLRGKKSKKMCSICTRKVKSSKSVHLGEDEFCEPCYRRQYMLRSAIEHFMVPSVQECSIEVPMNKKRNKFVSSRRMLPNVNLRGLEPAEVRYAQSEFHKFDMDNNGWINRAVLLPVMRACLSHAMSDRDLKVLFSSQSLKSMVQSFGLNDREDIHQIEFLALLAFVARERQRLRTTTNPGTKFTRSDLEMAYAFKNQFTSKQPAAMSPPPQAQRASLMVDGEHQPVVYRRTSLMERSPTDSAIDALNSPSPVDIPQSPSLQGQQQQPNPLLYGPGPPPPPPHHSRQGFGSPLHGSRLSPVGGLSASQNASNGYKLNIPEDLAEEDQEEIEMPSLPPDKDPSARKQINPLLTKGHPNSKQLMEEFKLTGGKADSWMLY